MNNNNTEQSKPVILADGKKENWATVSVMGDGALAKILDVHPVTVLHWRTAGKITGRPMGIRSDGKAAIYSYRLKDVLKEIKQNVNLKKVQKKIQ